MSRTLIAAVYENRTNIVKILLDEGIDIEFLFFTEEKLIVL